MSVFRAIALKILRSGRFRGHRRRLFLLARAKPPKATARNTAPLRVLVLGVYMADRMNTAEHLVEAFKSSGRLQVEQRWVALNGTTNSAALREVTSIVATRPEPKYALLNRLLRPTDVEEFDFIIACDDDIYLRRGFVESFIAYQEMFGFAMAQPARAWHSHFDHMFVLRRPWLTARQTSFVESGPLVCFRRDAARLLLPFDEASQLWGIDLVWAEIIRRSDLPMGIIDALSVDHSLRPQASTYNKAEEFAAMDRYLSGRPHIPMASAFKVVKRYR
jgi:hypothetical protein